MGDNKKSYGGKMILLLVYIALSKTLTLDSSVIEIAMWFNHHPFLLILMVGEIFNVTINIKK